MKRFDSNVHLTSETLVALSRGDRLNWFGIISSWGERPQGSSRECGSPISMFQPSSKEIKKYFKIYHPRPLFVYFLSFSNKQYKFYSKLMWSHNHTKLMWLFANHSDTNNSYTLSVIQNYSGCLVTLQMLNLLVGKLLM